MHKRKITVSYILMWLFALTFLFPFYVMLVGGFKNQMALQLTPPDLNPLKGMMLGNMREVFTNSNILQWLLNSFVLSVSVALVTVLIAAPAGYVFARKRFPGKNLLFAVVIATLIVPRQILLIPNFLVALKLKLTNSMIGLILTSVAPPFGIFLCRQFMQTVPNELLEAAEIDGCSDFGRFVRIMIPMSLPAMGALGIFAFLTAWNDYLWQMIMVSDAALQTIPIGIATYAQKSFNDTGSQMFAATVATIPMIAIFLACQRFFIKGITMGGVKG